jgi:tetratricopeptide (TPR) repeat protein
MKSEQMKSRWLPLLAVAGALAASPAYPEPFETNPVLATSDADYAAGKQAMDKKNWQEATRRFEIALKRNPDSADLENYLGYSYRHLKNFDRAFRHYKRAIEIDPRHRGAHEYIGEAYLMVNDLPNAEKHLAELRKICLLPCEELGDLEKAVAGYKSKKPG